ncbi:MAG: hypothetical protein OEV68_05515 [candidate division Zixibacteria bacterium]|nr:hypothetical protein [candidate division Zixibacteria bacterium]
MKFLAVFIAAFPRCCAWCTSSCATWMPGQTRASAAHRISLVAIGVAIIAAGCGPPKPAHERAAICQPYSTMVETNDGSMKIGWKTDCDRLISGYNIYISPTSIERFADTSALPFEPHNDVVYPGDTDPDDGIIYYEATNLNNGVLYQVAVRVVFADRTLSSPSEPIGGLCGPQGEFELVRRYSGALDGFSLAQGVHVRADNIDNDLYYYSKDGAHFIASPSRLDSFLRHNLFWPASNPELDWETEDFRSGLAPKQAANRVEVREGDSIRMLTSEGHWAMIKVLKIDADNGQGAVRLSYTFWPLGDGPRR